MTNTFSKWGEQRVVPITSSMFDRPRAIGKRYVLICEPQLRSFTLPYLPAIWGILKTYWEEHADFPELVHWYPPIHRMEAPEVITGSLDDTPIDVLGLSCYTWNWRLQREIAKQIKRSHPQCLVIAGGPHPNYRDPDFFEDNPFIDAVVVKNGEVPFSQILQRVLAYPTMKDFSNAKRPLDDVPGLCLPKRNGKLTLAPQSPDSYIKSSYLAQRVYYEQFIREHPNGVAVAWETSRGCPFSCSYCDWGSSTMSKVQRFSMDRIDEEIDWFARSGVRVVFSVDSNFGMFKSDVDITDAIVRGKEQYGSPVYFIYSNAKNVPDRTVEITRKVVQAGLDTAHTLSIQHSSVEVLQATDRENISIEKQIKVVQHLQSDGIPINAQLILGLPNDTPALWRKTFTDLMEWGIHDGYIVTNYHLLPNAPAAMPEYRDKWGIESIERYIYDGPGVQEDKKVDPLTYPRGEVIVATASFTRSDWVRMSTESACIRALHNAGLTQSVSRYLRCTHGIGYHDFYSDLLDLFFPRFRMTNDLVTTLQQCYSRFLDDEFYLALLPLPGVIEDDKHIEPHRWMFARICQQSDSFFDALTEFLCNRYSGISRIESVCQFQRSIVVRPSFDPLRGASFPMDCDWPEYFARSETLIPSKPASEPQDTPGAMLSIHDTDWDDKTGRGAFDWPTDMSHRSWNRWFYTIATNRLSARKCNHQLLRLQQRQRIV